MSDLGLGGTDRFRGPEQGIQPPDPEPRVVYVDRIVEKSRSTTGYWVAIVILGFLLFCAGVCSIVLLCVCGELGEREDELTAQVDDLRNRLEQSETNRRETEEAVGTMLDLVGSSYPVIISDIEIGNVHQNNDVISDFGNTLYSSTAEYLRPRIKYFGLVEGQRMLKTKWIRPDGSVIAGSSSPSGFSQSADYAIESGANQTLEMGGWGWDEPGNWSEGDYRFEVWYGNTCLKAKNFTIHY